MLRNRMWAALVVLSIAAVAQAEPPVAGSTTAPSVYAGLRRSSYGQPAKATSDAWWITRAKQFAAGLGAQPAIVQIVSGYQDDGSTQFEFAKPAGYTGPTDHMKFQNEGINHERALSAYDAAGVKAIVQFEPGEADMSACIEVAQAALGKHPCIIGYGVDAEWYFTRQSKDKSGRPVTDAEAQAWMEKVLSFNKDYTLFIKHWDAKHLPPKYRHKQLWFLSDSQDFASRDELLADFKGWAKATEGSVSGYQFGYPKDRRWWGKMKEPPVELGQVIQKDIASCRYLFWVDFTADKVGFGP